MSILKKSLVLLLVGTMLIPVGCSKKEAATEATPTSANSKFNKGGAFPICKEKVPLKITIRSSAQVEDYETNRQTQIIEEKGNYDLSFNVIQSSEYDTKLNLMVAAGGEDLGDIIMRNDFADSMVYQYALADVIVPLTKYYKDPDASYYSQDAIKRTGVDFLPQITSPDGEIYGLARFNQSISNEYPAKFWIFPDWLTKLNLKAPTTPDELYDVLKAFKTKDPNGNGKADEIPMAGSTADTFWLQYLMNPFVYAGDTNYYTVDNGKLGFAYTSEGWKEGLKYIKKLVSEDLLTPLTLTQDKKGLQALLDNKETIVGSSVATGMNLIMNAKDQRVVKYTGYAPLKGKNGTQYATFRPGIARNGMLVTKNCKDVEAAFRLGDYMVSEEMSKHTRWGEYGVDYVDPKPGEVGLYDKQGFKTTIKEVLTWGPIQNKHWAGMGPWVREYALAAGVVWSGDPLDTAKPIADAQMIYTGKTPKEYIPKLIFTDEESEIVTAAQKSMETYVKESMAAFVTGAKDIDKDWSSYLNELEKMGASKVLSTSQKAYDRMYKNK